MRGERVYSKAPYGRWASTTMISSIRRNGKTACMVVEAATDGEVFVQYIRQVLMPTLQPGDCVIMDNLSPHKLTLVKRLLKSVGVEIRWLPAYSPDLNPIEKMWSKIKEILRSMEARTQEELYQAIAKAFQMITATDAENWFASCGYTIN